MKKFIGKLAAAFAGLVLVAGVASATVAPSYYAGYRQEANQNGLNGLLVSGGVAPTTAASTCSSGTVTAKGGASYGEVDTTTCTTLVLVLTGAKSGLTVSQAPPPTGNSPYFGTATNSSAPPTGAICLSYDVTHPSDNTVSGAWNVGTFAFVGTGTTYTGYTCTFASLTITASDVVLYMVLGY